MSIRLFEHPVKRRLFGRAGLSITGSLPSYVVYSAYEGRLQIVGNVGDCTAWLTSGDLPPGATVRVDNTTSEIVVAWPAYVSDYADVPNGSFADGATGWEYGAGWVYRADHSPFDECAQFENYSGESILANAVRVAVTPGQAITASCKVDQGASSKGNAGAAVRMEFFDASGNPLDPAEGNMVQGGGDSDGVSTSSLATEAPATAASARIAARAFRKRQNRRVYVDQFEWNLSQPSVGTSAEVEYCITIKARDSAGREAEWSGCVDAAPLSLTARHWRIYMNSFPQLGQQFANIGIFSLRSTPGGENICYGAGGTATESSKLDPSYGAINAFNKQNADAISGAFWHSASQTEGWWAAYDFGAGNEKTVVELMMSCVNQPNRAPLDFYVQTSPDGVTWTTVKAIVGEYPNWPTDTTRTFSLE